MQIVSCISTLENIDKTENNTFQHLKLLKQARMKLDSQFSILTLLAMKTPEINELKCFLLSIAIQVTLHDLILT